MKTFARVDYLIIHRTALSFQENHTSPHHSESTADISYAWHHNLQSLSSQLDTVMESDPRSLPNNLLMQTRSQKLSNPSAYECQKCCSVILLMWLVFPAVVEVAFQITDENYLNLIRTCLASHLVSVALVSSQRFVSPSPLLQKRHHLVPQPHSEHSAQSVA